MVDPIITNASSDFTVEFGYTGQSLSWTATDANPNTYTIEHQGTGIIAGPIAWTSGIEITYNVLNGLAVGEYLYTVNFTDDYDNFVTDTITMTVQEVQPIPFELIIITLVIGGGAVIGVAVVVLIRRKRKNTQI